jgi:hypothetical protein
VSGYGLDDRAIQGRSPEEEKDFSSDLCVQTGSGAHPASCSMGTGDPLPGGKVRPGRDADHSPDLVLRSRMSRSYTSSRPCTAIGVLWDCFTFSVLDRSLFFFEERSKKTMLYRLFYLKQSLFQNCTVYLSFITYDCYECALTQNRRDIIVKGLYMSQNNADLFYELRSLLWL